MSIAGKRTVKRGAEYYAYLRSDAWYEVKLRYLQSKLPKNCYICAAPWSNAFVFHHRTYKNLGCERLMDIVPVCRPCHDIVHASARTLRLSLWQATNLHRRHATKNEVGATRIKIQQRTEQQKQKIHAKRRRKAERRAMRKNNADR